MTPQQLLQTAGQLLVAPPVSMRRCWQRGCAALTRLALEQGLQRYWQRTAAGIAHLPMRHQLLALALDRFAGPEPARTAGAVWHGLSRAMHHHTYELPPTTAELQNWHGDVARLLTALAEGTPAAS